MILNDVCFWSSESLENRMEHQAKRQKTRQTGRCEGDDLDLPSSCNLHEKEALDQFDNDLTDVNSQ